MKLEELGPFPAELPVVIYDKTFFYPFMITSVVLDGPTYERMIEEAMGSNKALFIATSGSAKNLPNTHGVIAVPVRKVALSAGQIKVLLQGVSKGIARDYQITKRIATVEVVGQKNYNKIETSALASLLKERLQELSDLTSSIPQELIEPLETNANPYRFADLISSIIKIDNATAYRLFKIDDIKERLLEINTLVAKELEYASVQRLIQAKVQSRIEKINKEHYLREQLKEIRSELGEQAQKEEESEAFKKSLESIKKHISPEAYKEISRQIDRYSRAHPDSADSNLLYGYLEKVFELPLGKFDQQKLSVVNIQERLDSDHYGLEEIKERIVEYFSVKELFDLRGIKTQEQASTILCFVGPPGVGKTSLANSIAKALSRSLVKIALGGLDDTSELRGHRRTYVGAMPGRIVQGLIDAKSMNPVVVLDEIDKIASSHRGDPTSVMLEILDPAQNKEFRDYYLNFNIDISKVLFIATANNLSKIPRPLRDRMEIIELSSYTPSQKFQIASRYLIPQELKKHALKRQELTITPKAIEYIIDYYTREAGVRRLRQQIAALMRKVAAKLVASTIPQEAIKIGKKNLKEYLKAPIFEPTKIPKEPTVGLVNGLAWTAVGGDVMAIEALKVPGTGALEITGSLGNVMKESARIAYSVVKEILVEEGQIDPAQKPTYNIHIHAPEGATPKDGPSAGIAIALAIYSLLTNQKIDNTIAMTGEITLKGEVLPIGGLKEKLIGAYKSGVKRALIPERNYKIDIEDIPDEVRQGIEIIPVKRFDEVLKLSLNSL